MVTRAKAFLVHLGISTVIFLGLLYLIVFVWYPQPYFGADGGWQGIRIIVGVDLVLGPLLTLIVYKPGKPSLKLDLTVIALLQATALAWGTWLVHDQRTALVTFADGMFYSLNSERIEMAGDKAKALLDASERLPAYAVVRLPEDPETLWSMKLGYLKQGIPLYGLGDRYEPFGPETLRLVLARALDLQAAARDLPEVKTRLEDFLERAGGQAADYAFLPLQCRYQSLLLVLDRQHGSVAGKLELDPYKLVRYSPSKSRPPAKPR